MTQVPKEALEAVRTARWLFLDWDGCLARGDLLLPGAGRFVRRHAERIVILSNNSTERPDELTHRLAEVGARIPPERVLLAGWESLGYLREHHADEEVFILANRLMREEALRMGLKTSDTAASVVLLMRDTDLSYQRLQTAVDLLRNGARLVVSNPDFTHPGPEARVVPETGALLAMITACVNVGASDMCVIGKPSPYLFQLGLRRLGISPDEAVMIGDNPNTDIRGADSVGLRHVLIREHAGLTIETLDRALEAAD